MKAAVVGHVEWVSFARVEHIPAGDEIVHALEEFEEAAGGGSVAAVQLARLSGSCTFLTALGDDDLGRRAEGRLRELGVDVHVAWREEPTRRAFVHLDPAGERAITVIGDRLVPHGADALPWAELAGFDAVYFTGGDVAAALAARRARVLVATPRAAAALAHVEPDALVYSSRDADEVAWAEAVSARALVRTAGAMGGTFDVDHGHWRDERGFAAAQTAGVWQAEPAPGPVVDAYGCGDSFAAGLTFALGRGELLADAVMVGARCGAVCLTGRGPYGAPL